MVHHWVRVDVLTANLAFLTILRLLNLHDRTSRGIGLEMTRQLLRTPSNTVIAACRNPSKADALRALADGKLHIVALDVVDRESVRKCAEEVTALVGDKGLDYLVNNAGVVSASFSDYRTGRETNENGCLFLAYASGFGRYGHGLRHGLGRPPADIPNQRDGTSLRHPVPHSSRREEPEDGRPQHLQCPGKQRA